MAVSGNEKPYGGNAPEPSHHLLVFSGSDAASVEEAVEKVSSHIEAHPDDLLPDIAHTLAHAAATSPGEVTHQSHRAYAVVERQDDSPLRPQLSPVVAAPSRRRATYFVFTGQGAQWAGMGAELLAGYPSFRADIQKMDRVLQQLPHPPLWTIEDELSRSSEKSRIQQPELSLPVSAALQIALVNLLRDRHSILPAAVLGHSTGEIPAAYAAGTLTLPAAITVAYYCGHAAQHLVTQGEGGMAVVGLGRGAVEAYLAGIEHEEEEGEAAVVVACENSPQNVTLSGNRAALEAVVERIKADHPDRVSRLLRVERAFHSRHMRDIGPQLETLLRQGLDAVSDGVGGQRSSNSRAPLIPCFSTVTAGKVEGKGSHDADYWRGNLEAPVRFYDAVQLMLQSAASSKEEGVVLLEIGPHSALSQPLNEILSAQEELEVSVQYVPTIVRGQSVVKSLLSSMGQLYQHSVDVNLSTGVSGGKLIDDLLS